MGFGFFDPYRPIRLKIYQTHRQFKYYREFSCSMVLANTKPVFVMLDAPSIAGAMFGNIGLRVGNAGKAGSRPPIGSVFGPGGKMLQGQERRPHNTIFSSVIVAEVYLLQQKVRHINRRAWEKELGRRLGLQEIKCLGEQIPDAGDNEVIRLVVYENPFARIPLSRELFNGPYDERYGDGDGGFQRIFVGEGIEKIEKLLAQDG